jgi:hypothetical protein
MDVDEAEPGQGQQGRLQDAAVGRQHGNVGCGSAEHGYGWVVVRVFGSEKVESELAGPGFHRGGNQFQPAAGRPGWSRYYEADVMARFRKPLKTRHAELCRAEED